MPHPARLQIKWPNRSAIVTSRLIALCGLICLLPLVGCEFPGGVGAQAALGDDAATEDPATDDAATEDADQPAEASEDDVPTENPFPGRFPAPSLDGGVEWFNTAEPIDLRDLRGKIVLLDFWTYCCINCIHVLPDLHYLEQKYPNNLVVIGVHAPKFDNERDSENIRQAILRYEIEHPVVNDADMTIARKFNFRSWPTLVIIDPEGQYVGYQSGEGNRELFDLVITEMLAFHREKGTLNEEPIDFALERDQEPPTALRFPGKIVADEAGGRLFISDSNHNRIVIASLDGQLIETIGTGQIGWRDGVFEEAVFDHPQGMVLDGDILYVADTENHLIRQINLSSRTVTTLAGTGEQSRGRLPGGPPLETALNSPWDLTIVGNTMYICMAGPHQLWSHELGSDTIGPYAGNGREDIIDGSLASSSLAQPSGITHDGTRLYFVDSEGSAVREASLDPDGDVRTIAGAHDLPFGRSLFEFADIDGIGEDARLQHPLGIVQHEGWLYVADSYNHKIKLVDPSTGECRTWLGEGVAGDSLDPVHFSEPAGLAIVGDSLFVADTNNHRILRINLLTRAATEFVVAGLAPPQESGGIAAATDEPVTLDSQRIKPGENLTFNFSFTLPEGFKMNPEAPMTCKLTPVGDQTLIGADSLDQVLAATVDHDNLQATFQVPLAAQSGSGTYQLRVGYSYCLGGPEGECRLGRITWQIPIELAADAQAEAVSLDVVGE